jgi:hypothetical protein
MTDRFPSTNDQRTANNTTRQAYRKLSDAEKARMNNIKALGADFIAEICALEGRSVPSDDSPLTMRNLELARRHAEDAVMRAVRFITS